MQLTNHGVTGLCERACLNICRQVHILKEVMEGQQLLNEYIPVGAAQKLPSYFRHRYLVPWFLVGQPKLSLIVDSWDINGLMPAPG